MNKKLSEVLHETAKDLNRSGLMSDQTMRDFDELVLPQVKAYTPTQIKKLRKRNHASQAVFAAYLNTTVSTIQKWEQSQLQEVTDIFAKSWLLEKIQHLYSSV